MGSDTAYDPGFQVPAKCSQPLYEVITIKDRPLLTRRHNTKPLVFDVLGDYCANFILSGNDKGSMERYVVEKLKDMESMSGRKLKLLAYVSGEQPTSENYVVCSYYIYDEAGDRQKKLDRSKLD
ncbi:hypothetical protein H0O00_03615 [Candidatus Micrarchaeota archaeon]|nr:hypothetical protein [Candidatus Micrarchaeota archaeon]